MRYARVTYRVPGVQQLVIKELPNPQKVNAQPTFWEVTYDNQQVFMIPTHNLANVETFEKEEADVNGQPESEGQEAPADGEGPVAQPRSEPRE